MPRLPEFDRTEVLNAALGIFITDGYEASSINKLLDAMDINRGSLYASFGDKETLFREVMGTYVSNLKGLLTSTLIDTEDPLQAIENFFYGAFLHGDTIELAKGCLLFNTITELSYTNPLLAQEASDYMIQVRSLIFKRLEQARQQGQINPKANINTQADGLLAMIAGLRVLCKMGSSQHELQQVIDLMLANLAPST